MTNRTIRILILAVLLTAFAVGVAHSASFTYSSHRKEIKAGVLIFPTAPGVYADASRPAAPYVFHVLNNRMDVKPQGWEFVNPMAPSRVTKDIMDRWDTAGGSAYFESQAVSKDMGCYWEVKIDAGLAELSEFDILYIGLKGNYDLSRHYREKLRKLVDAGGVLWIENCSNGGASLTNFITPDIVFGNGGSGYASVPNRVHPLVHRPYDLSWDELSRLGTDTNELGGNGIHAAGGRKVGFANGRGDYYFATVIGCGTGTGNPIMVGAQYGSGHIVAVAEGIGYAVSTFASAGNTRFSADDRFTLAPTEDVKAAVNIVSWGGEHTTFHKNSRHTGSSFDEVGAPLALKWNFDEPRNAPMQTGSSPAILNDMVFYVDGMGILHAFDLSPAQDLPLADINGDGILDGDGNPDDGTVRDFADGKPWDEVWIAQLGAPASSPTAAYVPVGNGAAIPAVFVAVQPGNGPGEIRGYNALTGAPLMGGNGVIMTVNAYPPDAAQDGKLNIPAPTYFDRVLYAGDGLGYLHAFDLQLSKRWQWPLNPIPNLPPTLSSPTVGYFRNPITGSVDQLVYLAARGRPSMVNGCVYSFPIKVFNEVLTQSGPNQFRVRKYQQTSIREKDADNNPAYKLYYTMPDGSLEPIVSGVSIMKPGTFVLATPPPIGSMVIADYEVDTSDTTYQPMYRQRIDVKNKVVTAGNPPGLGVISTPAAGTNDTLYYATEQGGGAACSLYAVIEDGWGITTKWRWYLGDPGVVAHPGLPGLSGGEVVGSPVVGNGKVYFAINGGGNAYILAFEADPVFRISVGGPIDPRRPVEVLQYDSMNPGREPVAVSGAAEGTDTSRRRVAFKVDYDKGRITIENFLDPLSASQDLVVRFFPPTESGPGTRIEQVHQAFRTPGAAQYDDSWNHLAWGLRIPNAVITSSPMLLGSMLYFGDQEGRLHAANVQRISQSTAAGMVMVADPVANPGIHWVWPDMSQPSLGGPILSTVAGAGGNIAVSSMEGLAVLHNALTLVADSHRVLEMDSSGRVVWSCDSTTSYAGTRLKGTLDPVYGASKKAFNRPSVARRIGTSNVLVADTGNNRVVLMDRAGNVLCEISELDPDNLNGVLPADAPMKLNAPTDVWMWTVKDTQTDTLAYRFLITDSGNYRVITVDAVYDPNTGRYSTTKLIWATHTLEQGKRYRYISARRYPKVYDRSQAEVICVIDNFVPETDRLETTGGAIVTIDEQTGLIANYTDPGSPVDPDAPSGVRRFADRWDGSRGGSFKLTNPSFFSREFRANGEFVDLIGDSNGLYMIEFAPDRPQPLTAPKVYKASMHPSRPLIVTSAQLLPSKNVLVTNKASRLSSPLATERPGHQGEVFELAGDFTKVVWPAPNLELGQDSYPLEQPSSAERLYQ